MRWMWAVVLVVATVRAGAAELAGFVPGPAFGEQVKRITLESGVRLYLNAAGAFDPRRPTRVVVYATPNGNTLEQTLGRGLRPGDDGRFDIQHVAAQVRRLREVNGGRENIVLAVAEPPGRSWPAFRQKNADAGRVIRSVVDLAVAGLSGGEVRVVLTGHSGGGSFIFGYVNAFEAIPASVDRIAFLDANSGYDDAAGHGEKLMAWLGGEASRRLILIAYDDREITLDGKKVLGPLGGTFRATGRMVERVKKDAAVTDGSDGPFRTYSAFDGRLQFLVHRNPENRILHTALVGEMNGLLHALALGTPDEGKWGKFGGPRGYGGWVEGPMPAARDGGGERLALPARAKDAVGGAAFARQIEGLSLRDREAAILREIMAGNVPEFLRGLVPIRAAVVGSDGTRHAIVYHVTPDYLAVGSDADFFRVPMTPATAGAIAEAAGCRLVTRKVVDDVYRAAEVKLSPQPMTDRREAVGTFLEHHRMIEERRRAWGLPAGTLIAGIKKDVVVSNRLKERPGRVAIYGWHKADGSPIQPLTTVHGAQYVDYSHAVRLMSRIVVVDGARREAADVLRDGQLHVLLSDEGAMSFGSGDGLLQ